MKGWMYILECSDGSYYTGSTNNLEARLAQHQNGEGANHTKKRLPVKLLYTEEFQRIDEAFYREKQIQGWSRKKKEALMNGDFGKLSQLARNYTEFPRDVASTGSATETTAKTGSATETTAKTSSATQSASSTAETKENLLTPVVSTSSTTETTENPLSPVAEVAEITDAAEVAEVAAVAEPAEAAKETQK